MNTLVRILVAALIFFLLLFLFGMFLPVIGATGVLVCRVILVVIAIVFLLELAGWISLKRSPPA